MLEDKRAHTSTSWPYINIMAFEHDVVWHTRGLSENNPKCSRLFPTLPAILLLADHSDWQLNDHFTPRDQPHQVEENVQTDCYTSQTFTTRKVVYL
eukprot:352932-Chlamydomonas_euryale.AAC.4